MVTTSACRTTRAEHECREIESSPNSDIGCRLSIIRSFCKYIEKLDFYYKYMDHLSFELRTDRQTKADKQTDGWMDGWMDKL